MNQKPNNKFQICQLFVSRINADIKAAVDNAGGKTPRLQEAGFLCQRGLFRGPGKMFFQDVAGNRALIMVLPHCSLHPVDNLRRDALAKKIGPYFVPSPAAVLNQGAGPLQGRLIVIQVAPPGKGVQRISNRCGEKPFCRRRAFSSSWLYARRARKRQALARAFWRSASLSILLLAFLRRFFRLFWLFHLPYNAGFLHNFFLKFPAYLGVLPEK